MTSIGETISSSLAISDAIRESIAVTEAIHKALAVGTGETIAQLIGVSGSVDFSNEEAIGSIGNIGEAYWDATGISNALALAVGIMPPPTSVGLASVAVESLTSLGQALTSAVEMVNSPFIELGDIASAGLLGTVYRDAWIREIDLFQSATDKLRDGFILNGRTSFAETLEPMITDDDILG